MRLASVMLALSLVAAACERAAETPPPSATTSPPVTSGPPNDGSPVESPPEQQSPLEEGLDAAGSSGSDQQEEGVLDAAEQACRDLAENRYADRVAALTQARSEAGFDVDTVISTQCPDAYDRFETHDELAFNAASVNENTSVSAQCGAPDVTVTVFNNNLFSIDAGVLVQVGSAERGATGGTVVLALEIAAGDAREMTVDPAQVGTDAGADACAASVTAWEAATGPTATIFGSEQPIEDPGGRDLPQTRGDDPASIVAELIDFEVALFASPSGALIEEFEDVRSPNFLRLIAEFDERAEIGTTVAFTGSEISEVEIIDRPRDDLMLVGWTSAPGSITFLDAAGTPTGSAEFGTRIRRGIFLRSPEDGRWRWVHSAITVLQDDGRPLEDDDDTITADAVARRWS